MNISVPPPPHLSDFQKKKQNLYLSTFNIHQPIADALIQELFLIPFFIYRFRLNILLANDKF